MTNNDMKVQLILLCLETVISCITQNFLKSWAHTEIAFCCEEVLRVDSLVKFCKYGGAWVAHTATCCLLYHHDGFIIPPDCIITKQYIQMVFFGHKLKVSQ